MASKPGLKGYSDCSHGKAREGPRTGRTQKSEYKLKLLDNLWLTPEPHKGGAAPISPAPPEKPNGVLSGIQEEGFPAQVTLD